MRWMLPLLVIGLVGCAPKSFPGQWEGQRADGHRLVMDVKPDGFWAAEGVGDDGSVESFSGTWVMQPDGRAVFVQRGEPEYTAEVERIGENRLIFRSADTEMRFDRMRSK